jgi:hypothetical protein
VEVNNANRLLAACNAISGLHTPFADAVSYGAALAILFAAGGRRADRFPIYLFAKTTTKIKQNSPRKQGFAQKHVFTAIVKLVFSTKMLPEHDAGKARGQLLALWRSSFAAAGR